MNASDVLRLRTHVHELEQQLHIAKTLLRRAESQTSNSSPSHLNHAAGTPYSKIPVTLPLGPSLHNLLLVSDSALPLGSFAYSSGLESYLAHHKPLPPNTTPLTLFHQFLSLSIHSLTFSTVPYMLAAFRDPLDLADLDNDLDASTPCTVQRRASIAQGKALMSVWEKAMFPPRSPSPFSSHENNLNPNFNNNNNNDHDNDNDNDDDDDGESGDRAAIISLRMFAADLREAATLTLLTQTPNPNPNQSTTTITTTIEKTTIPGVNGHLAPIWGVVTRSLNLNLEEAGYIFLLNHAKAVLSAGVRASVMGPYMAQQILAGPQLQKVIRGCLERAWFVRPEDAGQVVPVMDLWIGRHELLYSRIFNS